MHLKHRLLQVVGAGAIWAALCGQIGLPAPAPVLYQGAPGSASQAQTSEIAYIIDGGGSAISASAATYGFLLVPFACTITSASLLADQSGSITVDIWVVAYGSFPPSVSNTITASDLPTLSSAQSEQDTTLSGWTTSVAANSVLAFHVNAGASTVQRVTVALACAAP